jgi:signal transduction histidine kinase
MSFRARLLLCVLLLLTVALDACLFLVVRQNTQMNLSRERARALAAHYQLAQSASSQLNALPEGADARNTLPVVHNQLVRGQAEAILFWYIDGQPALGEVPAPVPERLIAFDGLRRTAVSGAWLMAASSLPAPHEDIALVSAVSLAPLIEMNRLLARQMLGTALIASTLLLSFSWLLLSGLLAPVARLTAAMRRAMAGDFTARVRASGGGELTQLSLGFNRMARTTQRHLEELGESAQRNQRFADNLAHEMRTPVTAILGYARSLLAQPMDEADQRKALTYIATESQRMQRMSEALLQLTGLRQDGIEAREVPVSQLLDRAARAVTSELEERGLRLEARCGLDALVCDEALIESLLINLIVNAARASQPGQEIELAAGMHEEVPYLEVADHGRGMTREQAERATEAFYRTDKARARLSGGAGLGLTLVKQIADAHGAALTIDSEPGRGTAVRVEFTTRLQPCEDPDTVSPSQWKREPEHGFAKREGDGM